MELNEALKGQDVNEVKVKTDALVEASHQLAEAVYAQASAAGAGGGDSQPSGDGAAGDDHEVVEDADYEVVDEEAK